MLIKAGKKRLLTGKNRQEERRTQQMLQSRIANSMSSPLESEIQGAIKKLVKSYKDTGGSTDLFGLVLDDHTQNLSDILERQWTRAAQMAGERIIGAAKCAHGSHYIHKDTIGERFMDAVQLFISTRALQRVSGLSDTTIDQVKSKISIGLAGGFSVDEIANNINSLSGSMSKYRSMMIARTESHAAYNFGTQTGAESSDLMLQKEWISSGDIRTRDGENGFDHDGADGETVGVSSMFQETGEGLLYPGDPSGSAGNIIHCRCGRGDVLL